MPDVSRSDSQRSDASQRPRVSFNRDVHVKRISSVSPPEGGSLRLPVRRRLSRREGAAEARRALRQAGAVSCAATASAGLDLSDGFRSLRLPGRRGGSKAQPQAQPLSGELSASLTDLSAAQPERPKRRKHAAAGAAGSSSRLKRSQSERSAERPRRQPAASAAHSLERKRHKARPGLAKQQAEDEEEPQAAHADSDRSTSPRPRKNILKKSLSDTETRPEEAAPTQQQKQLSPIMEDPAGFQFPAAAPAVSVQTLVRRLSQETLQRRKPPRGLSPSAMVAPAADRRHNNNLPFSYTEPPPPPPVEGQQQQQQPVIYAEVVVGGGGSGKQTVHTQVAAAQRDRPPREEEDRDRDRAGMDLRLRRAATDGFRHEATEASEAALPGGGRATSARTELSYGDVSPDGGFRKHYLLHETSARYDADPSGRGRADGMDARRKDFPLEGAGRYDDRVFDPRPGAGGFHEFGSETRLYKEDALAGDLSSRRHRLESRIESQRRERFSTSYGQHKYATDPPRAGRYADRRDFLSSQIDYDDDEDDDVVRYENERNRRKSAAATRYVDLSTGANTTTATVASSGSGSKKDFFADSGIEVDYRKESRRYDDVQTAEGPSAKIFIGGRDRGSPSSPPPAPAAANVTRVDLRSGATPTPSPAAASDVDDDPRPGRHVGRAAATTTSFSSTRLLQESHSLPASTVLIRHYAPAEDRSREPSPKHRERDFRDRDKERERDRGRGHDRDRDRERGSGSREARDHGAGSTTTSTTTTTRTLSRAHREQRASEKLIRVERLAHGPEASDLELDGRYSALDDTDVDDRHYPPQQQQQRRRRERDRRPGDDDEADERRRARRKKLSEKADSREAEEPEQEQEQQQDQEELEEEGRADTIKRGGTLRAEEPRKRARDKDKKQGPSAMDKVRQLFSGSARKDKKKKKDKEKERAQKEEADRKRRQQQQQQEQDEDPVSARYTEYRGERLPDSDEETLRATPHSERRAAHRAPDPSQQTQTLRRDSRQRLATPSPRDSRRDNHNHNHSHNHSQGQSQGWFKSLDRLTSRARARDKSDVETTDAGVTEDEWRSSPAAPRHQSTPAGAGGKSLRFFGDTDAESVVSIPPPAAPLSRRYRTNAALHAGSKTLQVPTGGSDRRPQRSGGGGGGGGGGVSQGDAGTSSAESTTEGDSSRQSQRSVVYLHAATVGDIPGPRSHATARRAQSREELSSVTSSQLQPSTKTISRSISVLAPWRPKHYREGLEVHYTNEDNNRNYIKNGRPPKAPSQPRQAAAGSGATSSRAVARRRSGGADAASKIHAKQKVAKAASVESLSQRNGASGGVRHTLEMRSSAKKRAGGGLGPAGSVESLSRHSDHSNARLRAKDRSSASGKNSALNASAVELSTADTNGRGYKTSAHKKDADRAKDSGKVSRSASMPKDTRMTAGWFKLRNKKQGT